MSQQISKKNMGPKKLGYMTTPKKTSNNFNTVLGDTNKGPLVNPSTYSNMQNKNSVNHFHKKNEPKDFSKHFQNTDLSNTNTNTDFSKQFENIQSNSSNNINSQIQNKSIQRDYKNDFSDSGSGYTPTLNTEKSFKNNFDLQEQSTQQKMFQGFDHNDKISFVDSNTITSTPPQITNNFKVNTTNDKIITDVDITGSSSKNIGGANIHNMDNFYKLN